jgi:hypothetical protein
MSPNKAIKLIIIRTFTKIILPSGITYMFRHITQGNNGEGGEAGKGGRLGDQKADDGLPWGKPNRVGTPGSDSNIFVKQVEFSELWERVVTELEIPTG